MRKSLLAHCYEVMYFLIHSRDWIEIFLKKTIFCPSCTDILACWCELRLSQVSLIHRAQGCSFWLYSHAAAPVGDVVQVEILKDSWGPRGLLPVLASATL